jgi:hypothetical protein
LYFDIDGVLLDYEDRPKPALAAGAFERALQAAGFGHLVCVSGWAGMATDPAMRIPVSDQGLWLHRQVRELFPSSQWFLDRLILCTDPDRRGWSIDTSSDWYYVDDWADEYFAAAHGAELYQAELGRRIWCADPDNDGSEVLAWVTSI